MSNAVPCTLAKTNVEGRSKSQKTENSKTAAKNLDSAKKTFSSFFFLFFFHPHDEEKKPNKTLGKWTDPGEANPILLTANTRSKYRENRNAKKLTHRSVWQYIRASVWLETDAQSMPSSHSGPWDPNADDCAAGEGSDGHTG